MRGAFTRIRAIIDLLLLYPGIGIRTDDALYRFFGRNAFGSPVGMSIHMFANGADPEQTKRGWQEWLNAALA